MKTPEQILGLVISLTLLAGCATSPSLLERTYLAKIPPSYANHQAGIVSSPSDDDVQQAVAFGIAAKQESEPLEYAYLIKLSKSAVSTDVIYLRVETPLYLISRHVSDQARNYRALDQAFISYARTLGAVHLAATQQYMSSATWQAYAFSRQLILLRDGVRIEPLQELAAWAGANPFATQQQPSMASVMALIDQTAQRYGAPAANSSAGGNLQLAESDAVYAADELRKSGTYEIIFREPKVGLIGGVTTAEVRFQVSFANFR